MAENIKLPKNIRQMGTPGDRQKVYIEDYVYTYLHSFLKEKYRDDTLKAAVILGEYHKIGGTTYAFVKGAVSCDFSLLHEEMSEEMSQTIGNFFPGWDMLGWYVSSQGVDAHIQSEIKHHYARCQAHSPQYLIYEDELEREIQVFAWEQNALHYLNGYYIYYEKNPRMQEFLISEKGGRPQEMPTDHSAVVTPPQELVRNHTRQGGSMEQANHPTARSNRMEPELYRNNVSKSFADMREIMQEDRYTGQEAIVYQNTTVEKGRERSRKKQAAESKDKKPQRVVYAACAAILILLAAMGVSQMGNYQNLKQMQETISNAIIPAGSQNELQEAPEEDPTNQSVSVE